MTNYAKNALAQGWDRYCVVMYNPRTDKTTTQNCFRYGDMICWRDILGELQSDEWGNWTHIKTGTARYEIEEMDYGHQKNLGAPNRSERYERITRGGPMSKFNSAVEEAQYNYFNENGAYKRHSRMMDTLQQYANAGVINSGWLLAYEAHYHYNLISKAAMAKRAKPHSVHHAVESFHNYVEQGYTRLGQVLLGELDKAGRKIVKLDGIDLSAHNTSEEF